jgi:hypothetical protein
MQITRRQRHNSVTARNGENSSALPPGDFEFTKGVSNHRPGEGASL